MLPKLIAVDMDGTFLNRQRQYDRPRFERLFKIMHQLDIKFVIASGDSYVLLQQYFPDLYPQMNFVAKNGANIYLGVTKLYQSKIAPELIQQVMNVLQNFEPDPLIMCGPVNAYVLADTPEPTYQMVNSFYPNLKRVNDFADISEPILKIAMSLPFKERDQAVVDLRQQLAGALIPIPSGFGDIDINLPGVNKATGLLKMAKFWQIEPKDMVAFGDGGNDLEMLKLVGRSYAMANADQAVKDIAQQIIGDNNTSTVLDTIAKLISPKN